MSVKLILSVSESATNKLTNTSNVTAVLKVKATGSSASPETKRNGYISINGTVYSFSHTYKKSTTTTLKTVTQSIAHNYDGSGTASVIGYFKPYGGTVSSSITLTSFDRIHKVSFTANTTDSVQNLPQTQDKIYGTALKLSELSPQRANYNFIGWATSAYGAVAYLPGGQYQLDNNIVLYAVWEPQSATLTYNMNGYGSKNFSATLNYANEYKTEFNTDWVTPGYTFKSWNISSAGDDTKFLPDDVYKNNNTLYNILGQKVIPDTGYNILYAQCSKNIYTDQLKFKVQGSEEQVTGVTKATVQFQSPWDSSIKLGAYKQYYYLDGWYDSTNSNTGNKVFDADGNPVAGEYWVNGLWAHDLGKNELILYAIFLPYKENIHYLDTNSIDEDFTDYLSVTCDMGTQYNIESKIPNQVPIDTIILKDSDDKICWSLNSLLSNISYNDEIYPQNIIPYNYELDKLEQAFPGQIKKPGDTLQLIVEDQRLYTLYRDTSPSRISLVKEDFQYISESYVTDTNCLTEYFNYLQSNVSVITEKFQTSSNSFVAYFKFKTTNSTVKFDEAYQNKIVINIKNDDASFDKELNKSGNVQCESAWENGQLYYYILIKNNDSNCKLINWDTTTYYISLTGLQDNIGKTILTSDIITVKPPIILVDINEKGSSIGIFNSAHDEIPDSINKELILNSELLLCDANLSEYIENDLKVDGLPDVNKILLYLMKQQFDLSHPIGTIYQTSLPQMAPSDDAIFGADYFDPNGYWAGTWSLIQGKFLIGANANDWVYICTQNSSFTLSETSTVRWGAVVGNIEYFYRSTLNAGTYVANNTTFGGDPIPNVVKHVEIALTLGSSGGEKTHLLSGYEAAQKAVSISASGAHVHTFKTQADYASSGSKKGIYSNNDSTWSGTSVMTSSGAHTHSIGQSDAAVAHNNMPPYKVVNIWERIE